MPGSLTRPEVEGHVGGALAHLKLQSCIEHVGICKLIKGSGPCKNEGRNLVDDSTPTSFGQSSSFLSLLRAAAWGQQKDLRFGQCALRSRAIPYSSGFHRLYLGFRVQGLGFRLYHFKGLRGLQRV